MCTPIRAPLHMFHSSSSREDSTSGQGIVRHETPKSRISSHVFTHEPCQPIRAAHPCRISPKSNLSRRSSLRSLASDSEYAKSGFPRLTKTLWEVERGKKYSIWRRAPAEPQFSASVFKDLPREVYNCIVERLAQLHLEQEQSCLACYQRDLCRLCLTSRAWGRAATVHLYRKIWVLTNEDQSKLPTLNIKGTSRLKLLRRTLRERHTLARHVRELQMADFQFLYQNASIEREEIVNLVASLVMVCPNLERLVGFYAPYTHSFDRLSYALSKKPALEERVWVLDEDSEFEEEERDLMDGHYHAACDPTERFLELNSNHPKLTTLVLHQNSVVASDFLNFRAIIGTLRQYPALRHLSISGLPATSFTNLVLNSLPPNLESLRLENLPGVSDKGLQRFAASHLAATLKSISLINLDISNIDTISAFLSPHLAHLTNFLLSQYRTPDIVSPNDASPTFHSPSLKYMHWELRSQAGLPPTHLPDAPSSPITTPELETCLATSILATSIRILLLPSLHTIRAPYDPNGALQSLCCPLAPALLPSDSTIPNRLPRTPPSPRADSPISTTFNGARKSNADDPTVSALSPLRTRLAARKKSFVTVRITDPSGGFGLGGAIGGFVGDLNSAIRYNLRPNRSRLCEGLAREEEEGEKDREGETTSEWITGMGDVLGGCETVGRRGCGRHGGVGGNEGGWVAVGVREFF